jgi:hypothetical protein
MRLGYRDLDQENVALTERLEYEKARCVCRAAGFRASCELVAGARNCLYLLLTARKLPILGSR